MHSDLGSQIEWLSADWILPTVLVQDGFYPACHTVAEFTAHSKLQLPCTL